jgi:predicted TIM-barrel fold metal-dependent hydrolase
MNSTKRERERFTRRDLARMTALGIAGLAGAGIDSQRSAANDEKMEEGENVESRYSLKVDAYAHISPPKYSEVLRKDYPGFYTGVGFCPPLFNMQERFRIMEKYPNLKVVTHHCGGMVPYYEQRIAQHFGQLERGGKATYLRSLSKTPLEYYRMFYNDTAIHGNTPALMLAYHFRGAGHIVLGADMPLGDHYFGLMSYRKIINAIEAMEITSAEKKMIFSDNALRLLRITL